MDSEIDYGDESSNSDQSISKKIRNMEIELDKLRKTQEEIRNNKVIKNNQKWNSVFLLVIIIFLVSIPSILVILDRWVNLPEIRNYSRDYLCRINFLCIDGLPGYFFWIIIFLFISAIIVFIYGDVFSPYLSSMFRNYEEPKIDYKYKINKSLIFAVLLLIIEIVINLLIDRTPGAELLVIILLFYIYFVSHEEITFSMKFFKFLESISRYIKENTSSIAAIIISFVYLFLSIEEYYQSFGNFQWLFIVFLIPVLYLGKSKIKKLHPLFWISLFIVIFYSFQMNNWLYTKIGDEYAFFFFARDLANRPHFWQLTNLFSIDGVYGTHSVLSSIISNLLMRIFGFDHYGWLFSNYILIIASILFFFSFFQNFVDSKIALVCVFLLAFSSYLIGFSKIGYNNLQALLFVSIALWFSGKYLKNRTFSNAFLVGISMGFLLYTFQGAFFYFPVILIFYFIFNPPISKIVIKEYLVTLFGFFILSIPILFQPDFLDILNQGTFFNKSYLVESKETIFSHLESNFIFSVFSYLYLFKESHYVMYSMIDPITAIFYSIGFLVLIKNFLTKKIIRFIVITYIVLLFSIGMIHDYPAPPITRLFIILPWIYLIAALGLYLIRKLFLSVNLMPRKWVNFSSFILLFLIVVVNFLQSTLILQKKYAYYYFEPVVFKVMQYNTKNLFNRSEKPENYLFLTPENYDLNWMNMLQDVYNIPESKIQFSRIIYETQGFSEDWENRIESENELFIFAPTSFSEDILNQISMKMAENGRNLCYLRYREDSPILAYMWISPAKQFVCDDLFTFSK